jgi:hypothetical protein
VLADPRSLVSASMGGAWVDWITADHHCYSAATPHDLMRNVGLKVGNDSG